VSAGANRAAFQRVTLVLGLSLGVLLMVMAAPRLVAAILDGPADRVIFYIRHGATVTDEALRGLIVARRAAADWHETAQGDRDIAAAELELIHRGRSEAGYDQAEHAVRRSLALGPVDPYAWARLAHIAWLRDRDARTAVAALRASIRVGGYEPTLTTWRAGLILQLWDATPAEDRHAFAGQIRELAREQPKDLDRLSAADPEAARIVTEALGDARQ
jgi:hypothetical protein